MNADNPPATLHGYKVFHSKALDGYPRLQLAEHVPCSPAFRTQFNAWALEFFGMSEPMDSCISHQHRAIFCNARDFIAIRNLK